MTILPPNRASLNSPFSHPNVEAYEARKGIATIIQAAPSQDLPAFCMRGLRQSALSSSDERESDLHQLFERRIQAALTGNTNSDIALFPGYLIAAPGEGSTTVQNRGILFYDQFQFLLKNGCIDTDTTKLRGSICFSTVGSQGGQDGQKQDTGQNWLWQSIERPVLQYLHFTHEPAESSAPTVLNQISAKARRLWSETNFPLLLRYIHSCWAYSNNNVHYDAAALQHCRQWLTTLNRDIDDKRFLSTLFEMEAYASYLSHLSGAALAGGCFGGNWIEVSSIPLSKFRPTELCQNDRLLDELLALPGRAFAPIVVNEAMCVTDGNHRLTACRLWNLLCGHSHLDWDLSNSAFQSAVAKYVESEKIAPVLRHEMLFHLQAFLTNPGTKRTLLDRLKPITARERIITELPAVLLPEYLSGAVVKDPYDSGAAIKRAEPAIYESLCSSPTLVLPARASYHFTDRALLPWFSVVSINE